MTINVAKNIFRKANHMLEASNDDLALAKKKSGFTSKSEHDIVLKYVNDFLTSIEFIYSLNGTNFIQDKQVTQKGLARVPKNLSNILQLQN